VYIGDSRDLSISLYYSVGIGGGLKRNVFFTSIGIGRGLGL
jgi:hypothetical protein